MVTVEEMLAKAEAALKEFKEGESEGNSLVKLRLKLVNGDVLNSAQQQLWEASREASAGLATRSGCYHSDR